MLVLAADPCSPGINKFVALRATNLLSCFGRQDWLVRRHDASDQVPRYLDCAAQLEAEIERLEQLKLRDHRRLAKILKIYHFEDEIGRGLPLWLPAGMTIRQELEYLAQRYEREDGYVNVATPHIAKASLYHKSGHLPYYKEDMYNPIELDNEDYYLRPMNCPHHHMVYRSEPRSYRDLPVRISEWGQVYRYEKSGALNGLMRVRGFCMNDAHIYCRYDQVKAVSYTHLTLPTTPYV